MMPSEVVGPSVTAVAAGEWWLVVSESTARFSVRDKLVTTVHGSLPVVAGCGHISGSGDLEAARLELAAAGVATGNAHRDKDLRKPRFLDVDAHPSIVVEAGPAPLTSSGWAAPATLSARGKAVSVDLVGVPVEVTATRVRAQVTGTLDRSGLGIRVPSFVVGRHIAFEVDVVFTRQLAGAATEEGDAERAID